MGRWVKETEQITRELCVAVAMISTSASFRFVLSGVFLIKRLPCPYSVCSSFDEALDYVRKQAERQQLRLPDRVVMPWSDLT
jgi:hypothetical protein